MKIVFDINKVKVEYNPSIGKVRAMYNAYRRYIIWYCIKHRKRIPNDKQIGRIIFDLYDTKKNYFYTKWEIAKCQYKLNKLCNIINNF